MSGVVQPLAVTKGKKTKVYAALLGEGDRSQPASVVFTLTADAAKGATTLSVTSVTTTARKGQYLLFEDADEKVYLAQLSADYASGTSVSVVALPEPIPSTSVAAFPVPFKLRTNADVSFKQNVTDVNTFDHTVNGDASPGAATSEIKTDGEYSAYDPGYQTCVYATRNTLEVYLIRELQVPSPAFSKGKVTRGAAIVTARDEASPNEGNVSGNVSARFVGDVFEDDPVVAA
jgi:hypothetical protein